MRLFQTAEQAVDVSNWVINEEYGQYPEGARDKTLLYCPEIPPFNFLKPNGWYLFKRSSPRYQEQFWVEILAYRLGSIMDVIVPPAFVAYNVKEKQSGALIEWYISRDEEEIAGGDYCQKYIPDFDRKKGEQHNLQTVFQIFSDLAKEHNTSAPNFNWLHYWSKTFVFDSLIGNTDRHQDNWSILENIKTLAMRFSPVFDNGTSMGHEIFAKKFFQFNYPGYIENPLRGKHHMKWSQNDERQLGHFELIRKLADTYPETRSVMISCLEKINHTDFEDILNDLVEFEIPVRLNPERAKFMLKLLDFRHAKLLNELEN